MYAKTVKVSLPEGINALNATKLVRAAVEYVSFIQIGKSGSFVAGKSLLGIIGLGIVCGDEITISADGVDDEIAVETLASFLAPK